MKILIIDEWFHHTSEIASVRSNSLYKYWKRAGYKVHVLTMDKHLVASKAIVFDEADILSIDATTWLDKHYTRHRVKERQPAIYQASSKRQSIIGKFIKNTIVRYYLAGKQKKWEKNCKKVLKNIDFDYDVVFSTFGPATTLRLGRLVKRQYPHTKWIADFRDQPNHKIHSRVPRFLKGHWIKKLCSSSDLITCVSNGVLVETLPKSSRYKATVITNGFDIEALEGVVPNYDVNRLTFAYTGTVYIEDDFKVFLKTIYDLSSEGKIDKDKILLNYAGRNVQMLWDQAAKYGLESIVKNHGFVSRGDSFRIQFDSHVMLFSTWNTKKRQGVLKGKIFEQMMMNKSILGLINGQVKNSESKELFDRTGIGFCYEYATDDYDGLKSYVLDLYNQWTTNGKITCARSQEEVEKYNYKNIARDILVALEKVCP